MKESDLIKLIDRYFEGATTLEEEVGLRKALAVCDSEDPRIEEAKAVMTYVEMSAAYGAFAVSAHSSEAAISNRKRRGFWRGRGATWRIAVAACLLLVISAALMFPRDDHNCYTMIACVEDPSHEKAFDLINSQLEAMGEASGAVEDEVRESLDLFLDY